MVVPVADVAAAADQAAAAVEAPEEPLVPGANEPKSLHVLSKNVLNFNL